MKIRLESVADGGAIEAVIISAFHGAVHSSRTEQFIVRALRRARQLTVSLVAEVESAVVGYVAISPVSISTGAAGWYGLGPLAVLPALQRRGVGAQLVRHAVAELQGIGAAGCVVLGDPAYYSRFGFQPEPSLVLPGVPAEYFQALAFGGTPPSGRVAYHESFAAEC